MSPDDLIPMGTIDTEQTSVDEVLRWIDENDIIARTGNGTSDTVSDTVRTFRNTFIPFSNGNSPQNRMETQVENTGITEEECEV